MKIEDRIHGVNTYLDLGIKSIEELYMHRRKIERYKLSDFINEKLSKDDIYVEFNLNEWIMGKIVDISMNGIGFEIDQLEYTKFRELINSNELYIKIHYSNEVILAGTKIAWKIVIKEKEKPIVKGGLFFTIMESESKLKLATLLESIRNKI